MMSALNQQRLEVSDSQFSHDSCVVSFITALGSLALALVSLIPYLQAGVISPFAVWTTMFLLLNTAVKLVRSLVGNKINSAALLLDEPLAILITAVFIATAVSSLLFQPVEVIVPPNCLTGPLILFMLNIWSWTRRLKDKNHQSGDISD